VCSSLAARVNGPLSQLPLRTATASPVLKPAAATFDSVSVSAEQLHKHGPHGGPEFERNWFFKLQGILQVASSNGRIVQTPATSTFE
jgi:hypothetical protein